jgi:hypothetical protein
MAGLLLHAPTGELSLTGGSAKTCWTLKAPANHRVKILGIEIFFKGTSSSDTPVEIQLSRVTTDGGTSSSLTPSKNDENAGESPLSTVSYNYSAEPSTYGANLKTWEVQPQTGVIVYFPQGQEVVVKGGNEIGLLLKSTQNETVSIDVIYEE